MAPGGGPLYVVNSRNVKTGIGSVPPIRTATNQASRPIRVGWTPVAIAITPNGRTAYVVDRGGVGRMPAARAR